MYVQKQLLVVARVFRFTMAYKRKWSGSQSQKSGTRTKFSRRRRIRKSHKTPLAVKVARLARELKPEFKYCYDYNNSGVSTANTVGFQNGGVATDGHYVIQYPLCAVSEGDDVTNRTGRKIKLKSVRFE